jgi:hypothetical protein
MDTSSNFHDIYNKNIMKNIIACVVVPSAILVGVMWYFSIFVTETRIPTKKTEIIPIEIKTADIKLDTNYVTSFVKREVKPIHSLMIVQDTLAMTDSIQMVEAPPQYEMKRISKRVIDTVYVERIIVKEVPIEKDSFKTVRSSDIQSGVTWFVGIINTLILTLVGAKKLLAKTPIDARD